MSQARCKVIVSDATKERATGIVVMSPAIRGYEFETSVHRS